MLGYIKKADVLAIIDEHIRLHERVAKRAQERVDRDEEPEFKHHDIAIAKENKRQAEACKDLREEIQKL